MFNAFERTVAFRYLRARKGERFVSVIAIFSLVGIALGVATLIIVMSVMNGFRQELLGRILGLNGHITIYARAQAHIPDYEMLINRIKGMRDIVTVAPQVQGQALATVEAMKMENILKAERRGVVRKVRASAGASLRVDDVILEFE